MDVNDFLKNMKDMIIELNSIVHNYGFFLLNSALSAVEGALCYYTVLLPDQVSCP
jgi:hypothetical protein